VQSQYKHAYLPQALPQPYLILLISVQEHPYQYRFD
jgi:hypothetical protein